MQPNGAAVHGRVNEQRVLCGGRRDGEQHMTSEQMLSNVRCWEMQILILLVMKFLHLIP